MKKDELINLIEKIQVDEPNNILKTYFVKKPSVTKMYAFKPQVSNEIQHEIINLTFPCILNHLKTAALVEYNPIGVADCEIECMEKGNIEQIPLFFESISEDKIFEDMSELEVGKICFYSFQVSYDNQIFYMFRQFSKMKKLRSGYIVKFFKNELVSAEGDFLGIDEATDIIIFENHIYILNHIAMERIFNYRDQFLKKTNDAMNEIKGKNIFTNIEQFTEDCCKDVRIMKRFTNIMSQGRLPLFFDNYDKVPEIVCELGLDIEFDDIGQMIYRDKNQLYHIVNLMSDSYFQSLLANRIGIAKTEEALG